MKKNSARTPVGHDVRDEEPGVYAVRINNGRVRFTRRDFLKAGGALAAGSILTGCNLPSNTASSTKPAPIRAPTRTPIPSPTQTPTQPPPPWSCEKTKAHDYPISGFEFTKDNKYLVTRSSSENIVKVWSFPDGREMKSLTGHNSNITSLVISPDGQSLATGDQDGVIKFWSLLDGNEKNTWNAKGGSVRLYLTPDGQILVSRMRETGIFSLWSLPDGTLLNTLEHTSAGLAFCWFSPDSRVMVSLSYQEDTLMLWSLPNGKLIKKADLVSSSIPKFSPDSRYVFVGKEKTIEIWSLPNGKLVKTLEHDAKVSDFVALQNGDLLISGDESGVVKAWSLPQGVEQNTWQGDVSSYFMLSQDEKILASDNSADTVTIWTLPDGNLLNTIKYPADTYPWMELSPDSKVFALQNSEENFIELYSLADGSLLNKISQTDKIAIFRFSPDSKFLVTGDDSGAVKIWSVPDGEEFSCMVDLAASSPEVEGIDYSIEVDGETRTYTLPCGAPIPPGAVCTCNCVAGAGCACVGYSACSCVGDTCSCVGYSAPSTHYWYPN